MKLFTAFALAPFALLAATFPASAQDSRAAGSIGLGTNGISLEAKASLTSTLVARGGYNYLKGDIGDQDYDGIEYGVEFDASTVSVAADYHPFRNAFMFSAGVYFGERGAGLRAVPTGTVEIGGQTFTAAQVGTLVGDVSAADVAPFFGLGWDTTFYTQRRWSWFVRGGVILSDSPDVELSSVGGTLSNDPLFLAELEAEEQALEDDINEFDLYPVLEAGASYRF
ncbi:hypothetical protein [Parvularcula sp. IMCC14364]|uniref:hypothetical protein n=1 Tax=Parvularcula sp. IMCC14364 TaxID=3067902 RepID=UPI002740597B|nr:hypothetical protein [Parvularcula sp. IMCC14364]